MSGLQGSGQVGSPGTGGQGEWQFLQCFGERAPGEEIQDADIITTVEFDFGGDHLATGDRGGRVVLFERMAARKKICSADERPVQHKGRIHPYEFRYLTEFQSHEPEFDYLKSLEIEEKINKVRWGRGNSNGKMILSTNDKTIKLWRVYEKKIAQLADYNVPRPGGAAPARVNGALPPPLRIPRVVGNEKVLTSKCRRVYSNGHAYHINSISPSSDGETFISADDLRINMWHYEVPNKSFNIVDIKPSNMEDLTEVITSAEFHPTHCNLLLYSSSKGLVRLCDMRESALCDRGTRIFQEPEDQANRSFFHEIIASVSDVKFSRCGRYLASRDYMTVKLWDLNMERKPLSVFSVHEPLRAKLCELYENDCIFDRFEVSISGDGQNVATGSYGNFFRVFGVQDGQDTTLESSRDPQRKRFTDPKGAPGGQPQGSRFGVPKKKPEKKGMSVFESMNQADFASKLVHLSWHPESSLIAAAAFNSLYLFCTQS